MYFVFQEFNVESYLEDLAWSHLRAGLSHGSEAACRAVVVDSLVPSNP